MTNPITQAIEFANDPVNNGAGYLLEICFLNEDVLLAEVMSGGEKPRLRAMDPMTLEPGLEVFVNAECVTQVYLLWP